jgi:two-component system, NtrC family, nitrogen regulation sensor histidine kinase NtrY
MVFKSYQVQIIVRVLLIAVNCFGIAYLWTLNKYWFSFGNLIALLIIQLILLIRYLSKWQNDLKVFATSVQHGDFNISYNLIDPKDDHYEVYTMLNRITQYVRELKSQYVQQTQYFKYVADNVQVGLLVFDAMGGVVFINRECLSLFGKKDLKQLDDLRHTDASLLAGLQNMAVNQPAMLSSDRSKLVRLSARKSTIMVEAKPLHLISLVNIREEIEATELSSWQELISVLTHEIMNSITPIHSLSGSMSKYLDKIEGNDEIVTKAQNSLNVINRRSDSLMSFVDRYRSVSTVPLPAIQPVDLRQLFQAVLRLLENELEGVEVTVDLAATEVRCDPVQVEQILINLVKNAGHAMSSTEKKMLRITSSVNDGVIISISDSGGGIDPQIIDKIFIPFFTTRPGGSGIGLTLSRQIMQRHGGAITVESSENGTTFKLYFPKP